MNSGESSSAPTLQAVMAGLDSESKEDLMQFHDRLLKAYSNQVEVQNRQFSERAALADHVRQWADNLFKKNNE